MRPPFVLGCVLGCFPGKRPPVGPQVMLTVPRLIGFGIAFAIYKPGLPESLSKVEKNIEQIIKKNMLRAIFIGDGVPWFLGSMCVFFFDQTLQLTPDNFTSWDSLGNHVALKSWIFPSFAESGSCSFSEKKSQNFESWKKLGLFRNPRKNAGTSRVFFFFLT